MSDFKSTLSNKKQDELYNLIHEEIMQLRVTVARVPTPTISTKDIDELLSKLCYSVPLKAIQLFKSKKQ